VRSTHFRWQSQCEERLATSFKTRVPPTFCRFRATCLLSSLLSSLRPSLLCCCLSCLCRRRKNSYGFVSHFLNGLLSLSLLSSSPSYGILTAGHQLVNLVRPRKHVILPADLHLILNFVNSVASFRDTQSWVGTWCCLLYWSLFSLGGLLTCV
jgi:Second Longin domain of FUZ, MON1 and HPS1